MEKKMSEESRQKWDRWPAEFRQRALERMKTCQNVKGLARELGVSRQLLYWWMEQAVRELKGVLGQKTLEVDFFADALRRVEESRQRKGKSGATASTPESAS